MGRFLRWMLHEYEGWIVWKLDGLSMKDQDRRKGVLPWFVLNLGDPTEAPTQESPQNP